MNVLRRNQKTEKRIGAYHRRLHQMIKCRAKMTEDGYQKPKLSPAEILKIKTRN